MKKITPFLWFDDQAEEAAKFYVSIFRNSKITNVSRYGAAGPGPKGSVMSVTFRLDGQDFMALNGGPRFTFTPAISLYVNCKSQKEVDDLWRKLSRGGTIEQCGWLRDKYGLSWQIVPSILPKLLRDRSAKKSNSVMNAIMKMKKLDIGILRRAHDSA